MTDLFNEVMARAGWRCECTGECAVRNPHGGDGRCLAETRTGTGLTVAPADPGCSVAEAARLGAADLRAWCEHCLTKTEARARRAKARAARAAMTAAQGDLFGEWSA